MKLERGRQDWKGPLPVPHREDAELPRLRATVTPLLRLRRGGSVFDYIMATERIDFPAAKDRVAASEASRHRSEVEQQGRGP